MSPPDWLLVAVAWSVLAVWSLGVIAALLWASTLAVDVILTSLRCYGEFFAFMQARHAARRAKRGGS